LRTLRDRVVSGVNDLRGDAEAAGRFVRRAGLLDLIVVVVVGQRNEKFQFLHGAIPVLRSFPYNTLPNGRRRNFLEGRVIFSYIQN